MKSLCITCSLCWIFWALLVVSLPTTFSLSPSSLHVELRHGWTCPITGSQDSVPLMNSIPLLESGNFNVGFQFASKSQAKRACQNGALWILEMNISCKPSAGQDWLQSVVPDEAFDIDSKQTISLSYSELMESPLIQAAAAHSSTNLKPGDQVWILVDRQWSEPSWNGYPVSVTKDWLPPPRTYERLLMASEGNHSDWIVYQDDEIAVIHKPDNLTTISKKKFKRGDNGINDITPEEDLQSLLPFLLQCPKNKKGSKQQHASSSNNNIYLPRPIHRLDKQTSGLVLVAKSARAMKLLSKAFAERQVTKTYSAIVVMNSGKILANDAGQQQQQQQTKWQTIDYPIDGKPAVSSWRIVESTPDNPGNDNWSRLALLEVRPHTGRTHQIRRHLAYNLKSPIVGDAKYCYYASGNKLLDWHQDQPRMYLHCHELEFPYEWGDDCHDESSVSAATTTITTHSKPHSTVVTKMLSPSIRSSTTNKDDEETSNDTTPKGRTSSTRMRISIPLPSSFDERLLFQSS